MAVEEGKFYWVGGRLLKRLLRRKVLVVQEHLSRKDDGRGNEVLGFANETMVSIIRNGAPVDVMIPMRDVPPPADDL